MYVCCKAFLEETKGFQGVKGKEELNMFSDTFDNLSINREEGERVIRLHRENVENGDIARLMDKKINVISRFTKGYMVFGHMSDAEIQGLLLMHSANLSAVCADYMQRLHIKNLQTTYLAWRVRCNSNLASFGDKILRSGISKRSKQAVKVKKECVWEWNPYKSSEERAVKGSYTMDYLDEHFCGRLKYNRYNNSYMLDGRPVKVQELMRQCGLMQVVEEFNYVY